MGATSVTERLIEFRSANADGHGSPRPGFGPEPAADSIGKVKQDGSKNSLFGGLPAERRLRSCRSSPAMSLDFSWITIPRERSEFRPCRGTKHLTERASGCLCQLPDSSHADLGQSCPRRRTHSPHQLDG
jgi:hypothetical protein